MRLNLTATLGLDGAGFERGMDRAVEKARGFAEGLKGFVIGAVGIGTVEQAISKTVETADELVNASKRLGIGIENLQTLRRAAKDAGADFESLEKTFERLDVARAKALAGGQENQVFRNAFARLGVNADQLRTMSASNLFTGPLSRAAGSMSQENLGPLLRDLGLKDFGKIIPVLKTDFAELGAELKNAGAIMDADTAVKLKHLGEAASLLGNVFVSQLAPALLKFTEWAYTVILKGGGRVAAAGGAVGGAVGQGGTLKTLELLSTQALAIGLRIGGFAKSENDMVTFGAALQKKLGLQETGEAFNKGAKDAQQPWLDKLDSFQKLLDKWSKEAEGLNNQKTDLFKPDVTKVNLRAGVEAPTDSLVRVGNFLGGSQNAIARLAQERTHLLRRIAQNTEHLNPIRGFGGPGTAPFKKSPIQYPTLFGNHPLAFG